MAQTTAAGRTRNGARVSSAKKPLTTQKLQRAPAGPSERARIHLRNLGPLDKAELELHPLTIVAGPNNTGKSFITNVLYGFLTLLTNEELYEGLIRSQRYRKHPIYTARHHEELLEKGSTRIFLDLESYRKHAVDYFKGLASTYTKKINYVYNLDASYFKGSSFAIKLADARLSKVFKSFEIEGHGIEMGEVALAIRKPKNQPMSIDVQLEKSESRLSVLASAHIAAMIDDLLFQEFLPHPHIFSSERSAIGMFLKELDYSKSALLQKITELSARSMKSIQRKLARYVLPIHDNINYTRDLYSIIDRRSFTGSARPTKLHHLIERIMGVNYYVTHDEIRLKSLPGAKRKFDIPFHAASSSTRELALLVFYLKHTAQKGDLLILDEPEAHLDHVSQRHFAWFIANCLQAGLGVFLTTHSDILLKEINNLIMLASGDLDRKRFLRLHPMYSQQAGIDPMDMVVYSCMNHTLSPCEVNSRGMRVPSIDELLIDMRSAGGALDTFLPE